MYLIYSEKEYYQINEVHMDTLFNIVICDDDAYFVDDIYKRINVTAKSINVCCNIVKLYDGKELIEYCQQNMVDIVLADIDMPEKSGFDAIKLLQEKQPDLAVVFITAHEEYAFQAYNYHPFWFVSKRDMDILEDVLLKLFSKIQYRKNVQEIAYINIDKLIAINTEQVMYIKSSGHYLATYTLKGKECSFRCGIQQAYDYLKEVGFVCAHRSYIVNCRYIEKFTQKSIVLKNGEEISNSRNKDIVEQALALYKQFLRRSRW